MPDAAFFRPELFEFLRQLKRHNNREWFAKNKQRYVEAVQDPALLFISSFDPHLHKLSPHFVADARPTRGSLFRIYRDTRFSPDKRPFKTHVGIHFSHASGRDAHAPVFYLHLEPDNCFAAAGVWRPDSSALTKIRMAIVAEPERWAKARRKLELESDSLKGRREDSTQTTGSSRTSSGRTSWHRSGSPRRRCAAPIPCRASLLRAGRCCHSLSSRPGRWGWSHRCCRFSAHVLSLRCFQALCHCLNSTGYVDYGARRS
jgi:uncharacterized protein (TIGR02453 family)